MLKSGEGARTINDVSAGDRIIVGDLAAIVSCVVVTIQYDYRRVHSVNYFTPGGVSGRASAGNCRIASEEEWVALALGENKH